MKTNFKNDNNCENDSEAKPDHVKKELSKEEFEEYISKSGAKGSFMIYRSKNKDEELGIDEL